MSADFGSWKAVWLDFKGTVCAACGNEKRQHHSFCHRCFFFLPRNLKYDLYRRFGDGYEQAFRDALDWLREHPYRVWNVDEQRYLTAEEVRGRP